MGLTAFLISRISIWSGESGDTMGVFISESKFRNKDTQIFAVSPSPPPNASLKGAVANPLSFSLFGFVVLELCTILEHLTWKKFMHRQELGERKLPNSATLLLTLG